MSFGGSVSSMITSLKNNKRIPKRTFDSLEKRLTPDKNKLYFKNKANARQILEIRKKVRKEKRKEFLFNSILFLIIALFLWFVIGFVIF